MCLAVPGQVKAVEGSSARVLFGSIERLVQVDLTPDVQEGDYVLVHAGYAIQRLDAKEAEEILALLGEVAAELDGAQDGER